MDDDGYRDQEGADPAAAFERLRGEVSLLRHAVEGLTAARESIEIPDYEPTLARTERVLTVLTEQLEPVVESPALALTLGQVAEQMSGAANKARRQDQQLVTEARTALDQATRALHGIVASARTGSEQNMGLLWTGLGAAIVGMMLWAILAGVVARVVPMSWQWPERMATRTLAEPTMWDAGRHLMITADPDTWARVVAAATMAGDNRDAIEACRKSATKAKKAVRCTIEVKAEG